MSVSLDDLKTISAFVKRYPDLGKTEKGVRWEVFRSGTNGLDAHNAVVRRGNRVFINVPAYLNWLMAGDK